MSPPPEVIYDGKTGEAIPVDQTAPWDELTWFICAMVSTLGYDKAMAYIFGSTE